MGWLIVYEEYSRSVSASAAALGRLTLPHPVGVVLNKSIRDIAFLVFRLDLPNYSTHACGDLHHDYGSKSLLRRHDEALVHDDGVHVYLSIVV